MSLHCPLSLSPHLPPVFIHCLQTFLVPFSDQLLDNEELRDLEASDPCLKPVELPDPEELLAREVLPFPPLCLLSDVCLGELLYVLSVNPPDGLGELGLAGDLPLSLPLLFPDPFLPSSPAGVVL